MPRSSFDTCKCLCIAAGGLLPLSALADQIYIQNYSFESANTETVSGLPSL